MNLLESVFLGIVQGLTEFLPVSSSGHLKLVQYLMGYDHLERYILFDLFCHLGTLGSILIIFRKEIINALSPLSLRFWQVVIGTLPLFPLLLVIKPIKEAYNSPHLLGYFFLATAAILWLGTHFNKATSSETIRPGKACKDALLIGVFQAIAIFPGISRSGSTISGGKLLGWDSHQAVTFSFLLAIPAILGGISYELLQAYSKEGFSTIESIGVLPLAAGGITSFIVGCGALLAVQSMAIKNKFMYFSYYCLCLGIATLYYIG